MDISLLHQYVDFLIIKEEKEKDELLKLLIGDSEILTSGVKKFRYQFLKILENFSLPFTCLKENIYKDDMYSDSYCRYFSKKHFNIENYSVRLVMFEGLVYWNDFISNNRIEQETLNDKIIGTIVIKPLNIGKIGMCFLNPYKMGLLKQYTCINLIEIIIYVIGNKFKFKAFPFSSQDFETITCAEISILNICRYFSKCDMSYSLITPEEIEKIVSINSFEGNVPTKGLSVELISKVLKDKGFNTLIYNNFNEGGSNLKQIFHYYIESGIPFIAVVEGIYGENKVLNHSVVIIGHSNLKEDWFNFESEIVDSSQFYDKYIIMDDNEIPYMECKYNNFCDSYMNKSKISNIIIPLHKEIYMDARCAFLNAKEILKNRDLGYKNIIESLNILSDISIENPIILRGYFALSDEFKKFRNLNSLNEKEGFYYSLLPLPKYIWVVELTLKDLYKEKKIFGELIMDSTSINWYESLIAIRYPGIITFRLPDQGINVIFKIFNDLNLFYDDDINNSYNMFIRNFK